MDDNNKIGSVNENMQVDEVLEASSETDMGVNTNQAAETVVPKDANTMKERDMGEVMAHQRVMKVVVQVLLYLFLCLMAIGVLFPFYWMIISSLKSFDEYRLSVPTFFPKHVLWSNYSEAFRQANLGQLFVNTVYVGIVSTVLSLDLRSCGVCICPSGIQGQKHHVRRIACNNDDSRRIVYNHQLYNRR